MNLDIVFGLERIEQDHRIHNEYGCIRKIDGKHALYHLTSHSAGLHCCLQKQSAAEQALRERQCSHNQKYSNYPTPSLLHMDHSRPLPLQQHTSHCGHGVWHQPYSLNFEHHLPYPAQLLTFQWLSQSLWPVTH